MLYTTVHCISNTPVWYIYGIYVFGYTVFSKITNDPFISARSFTYRELKYEPRTSVTSGINTNLYEVVSLVPKRQFFFGVYYTYLPYLLLSETVTREYVINLVDEALWVF